MEKNNTSSQAYSGGKDTKYEWTFIVNEYGMAYQKRYHQIAKSNSYMATLGIFAKASDWVNPPIAPPSENWRRESNRANSKMKKINDRGKKQCTPASSICGASLE